MIIQVIIPVTNLSAREQTIQTYAAAARTDCTIQAVCVDTGPASIETFFEDNLAVPEIMNRARLAEKNGADALIIDCMNDPGVEAVREMVDIPVVGAAQASMLLASLLAHRFSVISTDVRDVYPIERLVSRYGLQEKYASTRSVDVPVLDLGKDRHILLDIMAEKSVEAVVHDGAHALVFGCTGMKGMAKELRQLLLQQGLDVIVIDPSLAALKLSETLVDLRLTQSCLAYPRETATFPPDHSVHTLQECISGQGRLCIRRRIGAILPEGPGMDSSSESMKNMWQQYCHDGSQIELYPLENAPAVLNSRAVAGLLAPEIFRNVSKAQANEVDAIIIASMMEPALEGARELSSSAVIGKAQASFYIASAICDRFSVVGMKTQGLRYLSEQARDFGAERKLASVRILPDVGGESGRTDYDVDDLVKEVINAVDQDGAQAIILALSGQPDITGRLRLSLQQMGLFIPLIEPAACAVKVSEILADLSLAHSRRTYPTLPHKELVGYPDLVQD